MDKRDPKHWREHFINKFNLQSKGDKWIWTDPQTLSQEFIEGWELDAMAAKWARRHDK